MNEKPLRIGVLIDASRAYGRGICRGIANYAEAKENWIILAHERPELNELPPWLKGSPVDGLIAYIPNRKLYVRIKQLGIPVVDVNGRYRTAQIPTIESDAETTIDLALRFLSQFGFPNLAYCGYPSVFFSDQRERAFRRQAGKYSRRTAVYISASGRKAGADIYRFEKGIPADAAHLRTWLRKLRKPVGVLACNDIRGQQVINACREENLEVPQDVAVLGIDNDEIICRLCRPTLSSVEPDLENIGSIAAQFLDTLLAGGTVPLRHLVAPRHIVQRASTDTVVAESPIVVQAARRIRESDRIEISVEQLCEIVGVSRSTLDKLFVANLGRSVSAEIQRIRLERLENLLQNTDLPLAEIAGRCGFASATYLCRFFKRMTGATPQGYRKARLQSGRPATSAAHP
ncbi:MAG TPA: DNA-binding transcriptional regulator [Chthoniobacteraceae bacterium]|jgi:LacI family transcriptional regulator|nr:DNA-binding transcriptional regulator [Chthoniobacteraceae bacterium]